MSNKATQSLQPAYVLHRKQYRETSLLLEVMTADSGRVGLVARGARSGKRASAGLLQPFIPLLLSWRGHGELGTVCGIEGNGAYAPFAGPLLIAAFYLNELLMRLLPRNDPHPELFLAYQQTLQRLAAVPGEQEWILRLFEKSLLQEVGYGLLLAHEANSGEPIHADVCYCYVLEHGPIVEREAACAGLPVHGSTLIALEREHGYDSMNLAEAKRLMRMVLAQHLGGKPLRSRELFRQTYGRQR